MAPSSERGRSPIALERDPQMEEVLERLQLGSRAHRQELLQSGDTKQGVAHDLQYLVSEYNNIFQRDQYGAQIRETLAMWGPDVYDLEKNPGATLRIQDQLAWNRVDRFFMPRSFGVQSDVSSDDYTPQRADSQQISDSHSSSRPPRLTLMQRTFPSPSRTPMQYDPSARLGTPVRYSSQSQVVQHQQVQQLRHPHQAGAGRHHGDRSTDVLSAPRQDEKQEEKRPEPHRPALPLPTPIRVRYRAHTTIPYTVVRNDRPIVYTAEPSMHDRQRAYESLHLSQRPLAHPNPTKSEPVGRYALIEETAGRYHIEVKPGMPKKTIRRIARLLRVHAESRPDAKLNILQTGQERTLGLLKDLSSTRLMAILWKAVNTGGGTFVVISEKFGGALGKAFWRHPAITKLLSR